MKRIYPSDDRFDIEKRIGTRIDKYDFNVKEEWEHLEASFIKTKQGEEVLYINGLEVMAGFEEPYMKKLAQIACSKGGNVLNVGYGLGLADQFIEDFRSEYPVEEHHIIELNNDVIRRAEKWLSASPNKDKIVLHRGCWEDILGGLQTKFDGVLYDGFPLESDELCRDAIPFIEKLIDYKLLKENGVLTFFFDSSDGFGNDFIQFLQDLGIQNIRYEKVRVTPPTDRAPQHWSEDYFLAPILTGVLYSE